MGIETVIAFCLLALASAAGPVLTILIVSRIAGDFAGQLLKSLDATSIRLLGHLNEHRMLGGEPRDLIDRKMDLEEKRLEAEAKRQELLMQDHLEVQKSMRQESRDPFSGRIGRD